MNAFIDVAIDHPFFWPGFIILWFLASLVVGYVFGGIARRFNP